MPRVIRINWNAFELIFFLITPFGRELKVLLSRKAGSLSGLAPLKLREGDARGHN